MNKNVIFVLTLLACLILPADALCEERPVLTIGDVTDRSSRRVDGENQLGLWRYLEDALGVEIQYVHLSAEAYASGMTNGDLPDIVATNNNLSTIRENDVALDVEPYLKEYVPNFLQGHAGLTYTVFKQLQNNEEGFYFFPARIGYNNAGNGMGSAYRGYVVRWDYYKELGYPPIHNEDDYLHVLMQMHMNHPFTEEGYPTYLYGTNNFQGYETAFRSELDLNYWTAFKYQNNIFTNEIYDGYTDPAHSMWWTAMAWLNKLYHAGEGDGSFDLEIFTQTTEQYNSKRARGQYLGLPSVYEQFYKDKCTTDPDTLSGYAVVPTDGSNVYTNVYQLMGNGSAYMWFISANSPHKEEALRLFNYMCDPDFLREVFLGRKGVTWDYDAEGVPQMTEYGTEQLDAFKTGTADSDNYFAQWGSFNDLPNNWPILRDNLTHPDGYPLDFVTLTREYQAATATNNIVRDIRGHYEVELPPDAFYKLGGRDFRNDCGEGISSSINSLNRDQLHILDRAEEILKGVRVYLILAETDKEFHDLQEETIKKLTELGEPEVFEAYRQLWDNAAAIIVPMVRQVQRENGIEPYTAEQYE